MNTKNKRKELEQIYNPIISRVSGSRNSYTGPDMSNFDPNNMIPEEQEKIINIQTSDEPNIEKID